MRLLTLLIAAGVGSAQGNPLLKKALTLVSEQSLVGVTAKLGAFSGLLTGLNAVTEEVATRQEKRQDQKQSLRDKAAATANFVVWFHLDKREKTDKELKVKDFCQMVNMAKPVIKAKTKRGGFFSLTRWFTMKPSDELALFYVQEEIAKELRAKGYTIMDRTLRPAKVVVSKKSQEKS